MKVNASKHIDQLPFSRRFVLSASNVKQFFFRMNKYQPPDYEQSTLKTDNKYVVL